MKLRLERDGFTPISTTGTLYLDGQQFEWTLELPKKDGLPGSCIPTGTYKVIPHNSPRFGRVMPMLADVPGRSTILIHWGNTAKDTEGCILVGNTRPGKDYIGQSRIAFDDLWACIEDPLMGGDLTIEVTEPQETHLDAGDL